MSIYLDWDGHERVGPVRLGMTLEECRQAIPGVVDDRPAVDDPELQASLEPTFSWWSEEYGVDVLFFGETAQDIACFAEFLWQGENLIGVPLTTAVAALGGQAAVTTDLRDEGYDFLSIETVLGPEVSAQDGIVTFINIGNELDE